MGQKYIKGMFKDTAEVDQPQGSYRHAKNMLFNRIKGAMTNEPGTVGQSYTLEQENDFTEVVLHTIETTLDVNIVFCVLVSDFSGSTGPSRIYLEDARTYNGQLTEILSTQQGLLDNGNDFDLKFDTNYPIEGTYRIDPDNNLIIYWTDDNSPPRSLNVTRQLLSSPDRIYGVDPLTSPNKNYIDRLNWFPHSGPVPRIEFGALVDGGAIKSGTYYLFLAYVDLNFTQTNYVAKSIAVPVNEDVESVLPIERYDGTEADTQTGKSIVWNISNLNTDYEYLRPVVVARIGGVLRAYRLNDIDISGDTQTVTFSNLEGYAESTPEEIIVDTVSYSKAKTVTQLDNVAYMGNLEGTKDIGFQKHANAIGLSTVTHRIKNLDQFSVRQDNLMFGYLNEDPIEADKENGYRGMQMLSGPNNRRGYMRDEVYAFYIALILNDGTETYAYHIPGREALENVPGSQVKKKRSFGISTAPEYDEIADINDPGLTEMTSGNGQNFHFYDFADVSDKRTNYWENKNEQYPETDDYRTFDGTTEDSDRDLRGQQVRHHRMPTNATVPTVQQINNDFDGISLGQFDYRYRSFGDPTQSGQNLGVVGAGQFPNQVRVFFTQETGLLLDEASEWLDTGSTDPEDNAVEGFDAIPGDAQNEWVQGGTPPDGATIWFIWQSLDQNASGVEQGTLQAVNDDNIVINFGAGGIGGNISFTDFDSIGYCTIVWVSADAPVEETEGLLSAEVDALGIRLDNIKIPAEIASQIQGFRIYYAERSHSNRRILGQDVIKGCQIQDNLDVSACGSNTGADANEDFIVASGSPFSGNIREGTFHDFYLLHAGSTTADSGGARKSLVPATHTSIEYAATFRSFRGPGNPYPDGGDTADCLSQLSHVSLHIADEYDNSGSGSEWSHYPLREKCKTYLLGDSIYDGRAEGFGKRVMNLGGEDAILLGFRNDRRPTGFFQDYTNGADWWNTPGPDTEFLLTDPDQTNPLFGPVKLQVHNLHAFKTDMYLSYDTQDLIWTGFEVLGDELDNYVLNEDGSTPSGVTHQTSAIWGGDTFICRHGYRTTQRPSWVGTSPADDKSLYFLICESTFNINFRHITEVETSYFPGAPAKRMLDLKADVNLTDRENMKYNPDYTLGVADIKRPVPFPLREVDPTSFPNRVIRSAVADNSSLIDNYRVFLAAQLKDLPRNRGQIWKLEVLNNLLWMHMEDTLYRTTGKETQQISDGTEVFIGSGDIFARDPDELIQTEHGYLGTQSQWVSLVCSAGYFFMDYRNRKVWLYTDQAYEISKNGLENWFRENIPYELEEYGLPTGFDNPIEGIGFHAKFDQHYERILLTKRDRRPTTLFIDLATNALNAANLPENTQIAVWSDAEIRFILTDVAGSFEKAMSWEDENYFTPVGWTVSYHIESKFWVSYHDYIPYAYSRYKDFLVSFEQNSQYFWQHKAEDRRGRFYANEASPWEFEFIFNKVNDTYKLHPSFEYYVDVTDAKQSLNHDPGFTSFFVYDTHGLTPETPIEYMMNVRRTKNAWKVNQYRDMASLIDNTDPLYTGPHEGSNFGQVGVNVAGSNTDSVVTALSSPKFLIDGMNKTINTLYLDLAKPWHKRAKFSDKWVGIRLTFDNERQKTINLYTTAVSARNVHR